MVFNTSIQIGKISKMMYDLWNHVPSIVQFQVTSQGIRLKAGEYRGILLPWWQAQV
jgi:hypothetical protein